MDTINLLVAAILTGAGGALAAKLASKRSWRQPIEVCTAEEDTVLQWLAKDPAQWVRAYGVLEEEAFTTKERRARWHELEETARGAAGPTLQERITWAQETHDEAALDAACAILREKLGGEALAREDVESYLRSGGNVISAAASRAQNTERSPIEEADGEHGATLVRRLVPASGARLVGGGAAGAVLGLAGALAVGERFEGVALVVALIGVIVLGIGGVLVSLVDLDTFYLDTASFWVWAGTSWAAMGGAVILAGESDSLIVGVGASFGVAASFEIVARVWGKLRGITQGAGDTWIVVCTAGIPALIASTWQMAAWSVVAGATCAVGHWTYMAVRKEATRETPIPFGPWLVAGGGISMLLWAVLR
jgi:hypothetical protein